MLTQQIETITRAPLTSLDELSRAVWTDYAAGRLTETEATAASEAIETRRKALRRPEKGPAVLRVAVSREETRSTAGEAPRPGPRLRRN